MADDTVAVAELLGIERFAVLGMSVGGPYALACAARYPDRVTAAGLVASPASVPDLDPPWHRDDLSPEQQDFFRRLADLPIAVAIEMMRPDFEAYVARMAPADSDDRALARRLTEQLHPLDSALLAAMPTADIAAATREALTRTYGYLRDAAVTFRRWEFRPEQVRCPTRLWYGELDDNASVRNGRWLADRIPAATLVVRQQTAHLGTLMQHWDEILAVLPQFLTDGGPWRPPRAGFDQRTPRVDPAAANEPEVGVNGYDNEVGNIAVRSLATEQGQQPQLRERDRRTAAL